MKKLDIVKWFLEIILIIMVFYLYSLVDKDLLLSIRGFERISESGRVVIDYNRPTGKNITIGAEFETTNKQLILDYENPQLEERLNVLMSFLPLEKINFILVKNKEYSIWQPNDTMYLRTNFKNKFKYYKVEKIEDDKIVLGKSKFWWNLFFDNLDYDKKIEMNRKNLLIQAKDL